MINDNENEAENEKYITQISHQQTWPRYRHKYTKYKMYLSIMMAECVKKHLSNN